MQPNNHQLPDLKADYAVLQAIDDNAGKISRNKLHEVTNMTYKTLDKIIEKLVENNEIIFLKNKSGKQKKNNRWKTVEITRKGKSKLSQ
jgi:predicted transcriptional regulator